MLIVEGPDGAGKTNLVNRLLTMFDDLELMPKAVSSEAKSLVPIDDYIEAELDKGFGLRLYDRFALISAPQYITLPNRTFRGRMTDGPWLASMYNKFWKLDPVIIFCMPPLEEVLKNVMNEDTDNSVVADRERIETIYYLYLAFISQNFGRFATSWMVWDYTQGEFPWHRIDALMRYARARVEKGRKFSAR